MAMNADLTKATRELFLRSLQKEVYIKTPFVEELQRRRQITYKGGTSIKKLVDVDEIDDLMQEYTEKEALNDSSKATLEKPSFTTRYGQLPLKYGVEEELQNYGAGNEEQLLDLAAHLTKKGQRGTKLWLQRKIFNEGGTTGVADGSKKFQSLVSALDHDTTYGGLSRSLSANTNNWWQGADPSGLVSDISSSTQGTAAVMCKANLRKWINETDISLYMEGSDDLMILMAPSNWDKLAAEMEAAGQYKGGLKQKQGINSMYLDGHEIVSVPWMQKTSTTRTWVFILNLRYWELRIHKKRKFKVTPFKWQGENSNGYDFWLSRILIAGNLLCWKPNSSMWLSNVS